MNRCTRLWVVGMIFWGALGNAQAAELTAGAASVDLTPPMEMKATLGGYGERMSRPAEGVHDRVFVKALAVSDGNRRFALLTADILAFPPAFKPALVELLAEEGWTADQIMLLPSHSHTSIDMSAINPDNVFGNKQIGVFDEQVFQWTLQRSAAAIRQAAGSQAPVSIGTAAQELPGWNRNRRQSGGPTDNGLTVTRIDTTDAKPLAVLVNFTAHPTFMGAEHMLFSGGWPGHLQRAVEKQLGRGVVVMYYNGAEGDQAPVARSGASEDRWASAEQYGHDLAVEVRNLWTTIATSPELEFDYHLHKFELPTKTWHPDFMKTGGEEYGLSEELLEKMLPRMFPDKATSASLRLGELLIVGIPGEMTAELGLEIKQKTREITGARHVAIGGLANQWISYILTADQYQRGGYEASVSFYGPALGKCVAAAALDGVKGL